VAKPLARLISGVLQRRDYLRGPRDLLKGMPMTSTDAVLARLADSLRASTRPLFVTGAGVSADSGLPTYRGVGGLYERETIEEGLPIEQALSGRMLRTRPEIAWKYLWQIGSAVRRARPNRAHEVLAAVERLKPETWVLTQNIDGYHRQAGSRHVIEIHGRMGSLGCMGCPWVTDAETFFGPSTEAPPPLPPRCPRCGCPLRPSVVLFGELLPLAALAQLDHVLLGEPRDLVVVIGTTAVFPYIEQPVWLARQQGIPSFEINPAPSAVSHVVDGRVARRAAVALDQVWRLLGVPGG
jgi:NAD-dependent deacetylase